MASDIILQKNLIADNDYDKSRNLLYPTQFSFYCTLYPELKLNIHAINIPSVSLTENVMQTPFTGLKLLPSNIAYDPIAVSFYPDSEMENYKILNEWVVAIGFPEDFDQYRSEVDRRYFQEIIAKADDYYLRSDAIIVCRNVYGTVVKTFKFCGFYPTSIPEVPFESQNKEQVMSLTVNFAYDYYTIENPRLPLRYTGAVDDVNIILARIRRKIFDEYMSNNLYINNKINDEAVAYIESEEGISEIDDALDEEGQNKDRDELTKEVKEALIRKRKAGIADKFDMATKGEIEFEDLFADIFATDPNINKRVLEILNDVKDIVAAKNDKAKFLVAEDEVSEVNKEKLNVFFGTLRKYLPKYDDYGSDYKSVMMSIKRYKPDDVLTAWDRMYSDRETNKIISRYRAIKAIT